MFKLLQCLKYLPLIIEVIRDLIKWWNEDIKEWIQIWRRKHHAEQTSKVLKKAIKKEKKKERRKIIGEKWKEGKSSRGLGPSRNLSKD